MDTSLRELSNYVLSAPMKRGRGRLAVWRLRLRLVCKSLLAWLLSRHKPIQPSYCDVLLIHPSRKSYRQGRKKALLRALRARGLQVEEFIEDSDTALIRDRQFVRPLAPAPLPLYWYAAHAEFLLRRYHAKAVLTERNSWIVPSFIKVFRTKGMHVVHLAHSIPSRQSSRYDYFDYDLYLLFGKSSYNYLSSLIDAYGECHAAFAGPYFLSDREPVAQGAATQGNRAPRLLFLGSGPAYEGSDEYRQCCVWVLNWLKHNQAELFIKLHPRGGGEPWLAYKAASANISLLDKDDSLEDCVGRFDLVLCGYTNAVLDVARAGVPFVLLGRGEDYFEVERFELPRCRDELELSACVESVLSQPAQARERLAAFLEYHISHASYPLSSLVEHVERVVSAGVEPDSLRLPASVVKKQR